MPNSHNLETQPAEPHWEIENFYFGSAVWPSDTTYRTSGERVQCLIELGLPLKSQEGSSQYTANTEEVAAFLAQYQDCQFVVADSYDINDGAREAPYLWITGWKELPENERYMYERDKASAWRKP